VAAHALSGRWTSGRSWPGRCAARGSRAGSSASCSASTSNATRRPGVKPGLAMGLHRVPAGSRAPSRAFQGHRRLRFQLTILARRIVPRLSVEDEEVGRHIDPAVPRLDRGHAALIEERVVRVERIRARSGRRRLPDLGTLSQ
jgi:hypothetical protein